MYGTVVVGTVELVHVDSVPRRGSIDYKCVSDWRFIRGPMLDSVHVGHPNIDSRIVKVQ